MANRRLALFLVSTEFLTERLFFCPNLLICDGQFFLKITSNAPADLQIIATQWNMEKSELEVLCSSDSFDEVPLGSLIPVRSVVFSTTREPLPFVPSGESKTNQ